MSETQTRLEKMYVQFKAMRQEAITDCTFDKQNLYFNTAGTISKWICKKAEWNRVFRDFEEKRKKEYRRLYEFYHGEFAMKLNTKDEYTLFIESDESYTMHLHHSQVTKEILQFIDSTIDSLKTKSFEVKQFIEWQKFQAGQ